MGINPINWGHNVINGNFSNKKSHSLLDIEFNFVKDALRNKNCQNNVDFRLKNLKQNLEG